MKSLITYFIQRPLVVNLITFFIIAAGVLMLNNVNKEGIPSIPRTTLTVRTTYPVASPRQVELDVTVPLEEALGGVSGINTFTSVSFGNLSEIRIDLDADADFDKVKQDVRSAVDGVSLPGEVRDKPELREPKSTIIMGIVVYPGPGVSETVLKTRMLDLKKKILSLTDVAEFQPFGIRDREIKIRVDLAKLNDYYIGLDELVRSISDHNIQVAAGQIKQGRREEAIITVSKFEKLLDVRNLIIRGNFAGRQVRLRDVATVEDGFEERFQQVRINGRSGYFALVYKKDNADIISAVDAVRGAFRDYTESLRGEKVNFLVVFDISEATRIRLNIVLANAIIGLILVIVILFLFLNFKSALWTSLGIPFSLMAAVLLMPYFGVTINSISLLGMIVVLGLVVDDAIIVSENIYRLRLTGEPRQGAGIHGALQMANPVLATLLTSLAAFIPLLFVKGSVGSFIQEIPLIIILVLAASWFESFFIMPNHLSHPYRRGGKFVLGFTFGFPVGFIGGYYRLYELAHGFNGFLLWSGLGLAAGLLMGGLFLRFYKEPDETERGNRERPFMTALKNRYAAVLGGLLRFRYLVVVGFVLLSAAVVTLIAMTGNLRFVLFPQQNVDFFSIIGQTKKAKALEYTRREIGVLETYLTGPTFQGNVRDVVAQIGNRGRPENFTVTVYLAPGAVGEYEAVRRRVRQFMEKRGEYKNLFFKTGGGPPARDESDVTVNVVGNDNEVRRRLTDRVYRYLGGQEGVVNLRRADNNQKTEIVITPNESRMARLGVNSAAIANAVKIAYNGVIVSDTQTPQEKVGYRVVLQERYRRRLSTLGRLTVTNNTGKLIPLASMVRRRRRQVPDSIDHYNGDRATEVSADVDRRRTTPAAVYQTMRTDFDKLAAEHPGFRLVLGGKAEESVRTRGELINTLLVSVTLIMIILILLFRSFTQPLLVLFAVPFGVVGVLLAFAVQGMPLSIMAFLGIVGLAGVVVNDSLVMVETINGLRRQRPDEPLTALVREGAVLRLRPILLTTMTTVGGLLPTAYGLGGSDNLIIPTAMALAWGLVFATLLTLVLLPSIYLIETDLRRLVGGKRGNRESGFFAPWLKRNTKHHH